MTTIEKRILKYFAEQHVGEDHSVLISDVIWGIAGIYNKWVSTDVYNRYGFAIMDLRDAGLLKEDDRGRVYI